MARKTEWRTLNKIKEFESLGYAKSNHGLVHYMRNNMDFSHIKFFRPGVSAKNGSQGTTKYSSIDVFGSTFIGRVSYIYDIRRKKEFVDFLVRQFLIENPDPDISIRRVFTRMLHNNGLHWEGCCCKDDDKME